MVAASLGYYLLQDGEWGYYFLYEWQHTQFVNHGGGWESVGMFALFFISFWVASFIITKLLNMILPHISSRLAEVGYKAMNRIGL